jgi:hypothetical protein
MLVNTVGQGGVVLPGWLWARIRVWWLRRIRDELGLASRSGRKRFATSLRH